MVTFLLCWLLDVVHEGGGIVQEFKLLYITARDAKKTDELASDRAIMAGTKGDRGGELGGAVGGVGVLSESPSRA